MVKIWHNQKCSKSRASLEVLENSNEDFEIFNYLEDEVTTQMIEDILKKLNISARELMRVKEELYKELNVSNVADEKTLIEIMSKNPSLIERPIIIKNDKAVIGRPLENTIELLKV